MHNIVAYGFAVGNVLKFTRETIEAKNRMNWEEHRYWFQSNWKFTWKRRKNGSEKWITKWYPETNKKGIVLKGLCNLSDFIGKSSNYFTGFVIMSIDSSGNMQKLVLE